MRCLILLIAGACGLWASTARAQMQPTGQGANLSTLNSSTFNGGSNGAVGDQNGSSMSGIGYFSSTGLEGAERGYAEMLRGEGEYSRNTAAALIDLQTARQKAIGNWSYGVQTQWLLQDQWRERQRADVHRLSADQYREIARESAPRRLTLHQLTADGAINWPVVLRDSRFAALRVRMEVLFAERAFALRNYQPVAMANNREVRVVGDLMLAQLRRQLPEYEEHPAAWLEAKHFVESLKYEVMRG